MWLFFSYIKMFIHSYVFLLLKLMLESALKFISRTVHYTYKILDQYFKRKYQNGNYNILQVYISTTIQGLYIFTLHWQNRENTFIILISQGEIYFFYKLN